MITTWLKHWAQQAASRTERKQRLALIETTFPLHPSSAYRSADRRVVRGRTSAWQGGSHYPQFIEGAGND